MKRAAVIASGWFLVLLGSVGLFLPILPGVLLLILGLTILSVEYEWARRWLAALRRRFPVVGRKAQENPRSALGGLSARESARIAEIALTSIAPTRPESDSL